MRNSNFLKLIASILILFSFSGCWPGLDNIFPWGIDRIPLVSLFYDVTVVESVLCSGPTENFDPSDPGTYSYPTSLSEVFYCAYLETNVPDSVSIAWFYKDEDFSFARGPGQFVNESGYYFFSLQDSVNYSDHFWNQYDGEFSLENQFSEGALRVQIFDDRNTIMEEVFHLHPNSPNQ
ncbi:MAG: hypothetical protein ACK2T7_01005 [Anaerolineales bacterium]